MRRCSHVTIPLFVHWVVIMLSLSAVCRAFQGVRRSNALVGHLLSQSTCELLLL